jgi:hypothetical protein
MRTLVAWTVTGALTLAACGGNVVVDGNSGGTGALGAGGVSPTSGGGMGMGGFTDVGVGPGGFAGSDVGTGGCGGVQSCNDALLSGDMQCNQDSEAVADYDSLQTCAGCTDTGNCEGVCGVTLCQGVAVDETCLSCLQTGCAAELFACQND